MEFNQKEGLNLFRHKFILLLCGFLVFSPVSSQITMDFLRFPIALPELLFFPFYFYLRNKINLKVNLVQFSIGILFIISLIIIGIIADNFRLSSILSTARGYLYLVLSFSIFYNKKLNSITDIMYIALGSVLGWLFNSLVFFYTLFNNPTYEGSLAVYGNMITLSLAISIPLIFNKSKQSYFSLILGVLLSITTGIRRQILIFFVSYFLSVFLFFLTSIKNLIKTIFLLIVLMFVTIQLYPILENFLYEVSPILHQRIFTKSEQLFSGDLSESDMIRTKFLEDFFNTFWKNILPRGFVSKRTIEDFGTGIFMDAPFVELFYTFGILFCFFLFIYFIISIFFHLKKYFYYEVKESAVCIVSAVVLFILTLVEGSFLNYSFTTPFTGFVIARIFSRKNLVH